MNDQDPESGPVLLRPLSVAFRVIGTAVAPTSLVTALVFYFGWTRTASQARLLGLDESLLGFSLRDHVLRSVDAMFLPLALGSATALAALVVHARLLTLLQASVPDRGGPTPQMRRWIRRTALGVAALGVAATLAGLVGANVARPTRLVSMSSPPLATAGLIIAGYALHMRSRILGSSHPDTAEVRAVRLVAASIGMVLVLLGLFWSVARYAEIKGIDLALEVSTSLESLPDATVYSVSRLHLTDPVVETELGGEGDAYRFAYSGLKFLFRSDGNLFLRPASGTIPGTNVILPEGSGIRLELVGTL